MAWQWKSEFITIYWHFTYFFRLSQFKIELCVTSSAIHWFSCWLVVTDPGFLRLLKPISEANPNLLFGISFAKTCMKITEIALKTHARVAHSLLCHWAWDGFDNSIFVCKRWILGHMWKVSLVQVHHKLVWIAFQYKSKILIGWHCSSYIQVLFACGAFGSWSPLWEQINLQSGPVHKYSPW